MHTIDRALIVTGFLAAALACTHPILPGPEAGEPDSLLDAGEPACADAGTRGPSCGEGTVLAGTTCERAEGRRCGDGTVERDGACVAEAPAHAIRLGLSRVPADPHITVPVRFYAITPEGAPQTPAVRLEAMREDAGAIFGTRSDGLSQVGAFRPCDGAATGCLGAVTFAAHEIASGEVLATSAPVELVPALGAGVPDGCLGAPNVLYVHRWKGTSAAGPPAGTFISEARFALSAFVGETTSLVEVSVNSGGGLHHYLRLRAPFEIRRYDDVRRMPSDGGPSLEYTSTVGCNETSGWFEVHRFIVAGGRLRELLVTFEQQCDSYAHDLGCLHVSEP